MRNLFLALVLVNLAFAAWHAWFAAPSPTAVNAAPAGLPITLVSEAGNDVPAARGAAATSSEGAPRAAADVLATAAEPGAGADAAADADRCVSVGPFRELSEAATAAANLKSAGYDPTQRVGEGDIWVGYWVYLERIPTRSEATAMVAVLRDNGVADAYVIPGELDGDIISLGVFSDITRAGRLRDQVRQIGYEPVVVDRTRRGTVYWVDVLLGAAQRLDFEALQTPGRITRLEQRDCAAADP